MYFTHLVLTLITLPALFLRRPSPRGEGVSLEDGRDRWDRMLLAIAGFNRRYYLHLLVSMAVIGASLFWATQVELENRFCKVLPTFAPASQRF